MVVDNDEVGCGDLLEIAAESADRCPNRMGENDCAWRRHEADY
jgi:hypothetical protein